MKKIEILLLSALFCLFSSPVFAQERILRMDVRAAVSADATLTVTERIDFVAEGLKIRRGLVRWVPVDGRRDGYRVTGAFALKSAMLDGRPVPCTLQRERGVVKILLGDDSLLTHGEHAYVLTYTLTDQLAFHKDGDELYWNVTGNDWDFPIEKATFLLEPPKGASIFECNAWTGRYGATGRNWSRGKDGVFRTTRPLPPGEGFTVSGVWTKGFVTPPSIPPFRIFIEPQQRTLFYLLVLSIIVWYGGWWLAVGRDPRRGVVFPRFAPPADSGPGFVRYVKTLEFDTDMLSADLVDLAIQGYIRLESDGSDIVASETSKEWDPKLPLSHRRLLSTLFANDRTAVVLYRDPYMGDSRIFSTFIYSLFSALPLIYGVEKQKKKSTATRPPLVRRNRWIILTGLLPVALLLWLFAIIGGFEVFDQPGIMGDLLLVVLLEVYFLVLFSNLREKKHFSEKGFFGALFHRVRQLASAIVPVFLALTPLLLLFDFLPLFRSFPFPDNLIPLGIAAAVESAVIFSLLMPRRTAEGRKLLDQVEGLEMYLRTAEKHRMEALYPAARKWLPKWTPEQLFERLLPYAFALGVAHTWIDAFAPLLEARNYSPDWYPSSGAFSAGALRLLVSSFGSSVFSSVNAGNPRSGGGGSGRWGGGFSGGGGGGGGGGGR